MMQCRVVYERSKMCACVSETRAKTTKYDLVVWDFLYFSTTFRFVSIRAVVLRLKSDFRLEQFFPCIMYSSIYSSRVFMGHRTVSTLILSSNIYGETNEITYVYSDSQCAYRERTEWLNMSFRFEPNKIMCLILINFPCFFRFFFFKWLPHGLLTMAVGNFTYTHPQSMSSWIKRHTSIKCELDNWLPLN